jgi:hypothetical protein
VSLLPFHSFRQRKVVAQASSPHRQLTSGSRRDFIKARPSARFAQSTSRRPCSSRQAHELEGFTPMCLTSPHAGPARQAHPAEHACICKRLSQHLGEGQRQCPSISACSNATHFPCFPGSRKHGSLGAIKLRTNQPYPARDPPPSFPSQHEERCANDTQALPYHHQLTFRGRGHPQRNPRVQRMGVGIWVDASRRLRRTCPICLRGAQQVSTAEPHRDVWVRS